jgi:hypothetical protein
MGSLLALVTGAWLMSACAREEPVNKAIARSVVAGPGTRITLSEHTEFAWDKVCVFGPYTPDEQSTP